MANATSRFWQGRTFLEARADVDGAAVLSGLVRVSLGSTISANDIGLLPEEVVKFARQARRVAADVEAEVHGRKVA